MIKQNENTKKLARLAGVTTAVFNETARDLDIEMHYDENTRCWRIEDRKVAEELVAHIITSYAE